MQVTLLFFMRCRGMQVCGVEIQVLQKNGCAKKNDTPIGLGYLSFVLPSFVRPEPIGGLATDDSFEFARADFGNLVVGE